MPKKQHVKSLAALARAVGKHPATIQQWKKLGHIVKAGGGYDVEGTLKKRAESGFGKCGVDKDAAHDSLIDYDQFSESVEKYKVNRADILAFTQSQNISKQQVIIKKHVTEEKMDKWTANEAANWYSKLGLDFAVKYDKERLERGESTENVAVIVSAIKELKRKKFAQPQLQGG